LEYLTNFSMIIGGLILLVIGGELIVKGAVGIALNFNISTVIIGLTIVSIGTSAPEIMVSINAALTNHPDIAIGNIVGSNISNILLVLGTSALFYPIIIDKKLITRDLPFLIILTFLIILLCWTGKILSIFEGVILITCLISYILYTIKYSTPKTIMSQSEHEDYDKDLKDIEKEIHEIEEEIKEEELVKMKNSKAVIFIALSLLCLGTGAEILVDGAANLARFFGIKESIIGLTIVAIGSSAPELATCVVAAYRKHADIVAGNIIGSNLFNIMAGLSIASIITPVEVSDEFVYYDNWIMLIATCIFSLIVFYKHKVTRIAGLWFVILYVTYIISKFLNI